MNHFFSRNTIQILFISIFLVSWTKADVNMSQVESRIRSEVMSVRSDILREVNRLINNEKRNNNHNPVSEQQIVNRVISQMERKITLIVNNTIKQEFIELKRQIKNNGAIQNFKQKSEKNIKKIIQDYNKELFSCSLQSINRIKRTENIQNLPDDRLIGILQNCSTNTTH